MTSTTYASGYDSDSDSDSGSVTTENQHKDAASVKGRCNLVF